MNNPVQKTIIIIAGPTAVGKTAMALDIAKHFNTSIISADSRQCYKELNIGVARPVLKDLQAVPHYFIASHSIHDTVDAALFESYALQAADTIFQTRQVAVMVGGTGMYIKAFCDGLDAIPAVDKSIRLSIQNDYNEKGLEWLQTTVSREDPEYYNTGETQNPQRLMRALEVKRSSGHSIRFFQNKQVTTRKFDIIKIGLELPRPELNEHIHRRVDSMILDGLVNEALSLRPFQHLNALQTVGYKEIFDHLNGLCSMDAAIEYIKTNTRQYAKRQMTWFKKDEGIQWFSPFEKDKIINWLDSRDR